MTAAEAQRRAFRVTAPAAALALAGACALALGERYAFARALWVVRCTGWGALLALGLSLCATPAARLANRLAPSSVDPTLFPALRRALGLAAAALGALHLALVLAASLHGAAGALFSQPFLRSGLLSLSVLLALALTSFPAVNRAAGVKLWKPLHRLAYVAALLALHHALLSPFAPRAAALAFAGAVLAIGLLRFLPKRSSSSASAPAPRSSSPAPGGSSAPEAP